MFNNMVTYLIVTNLVTRSPTELALWGQVKKSKEQLVGGLSQEFMMMMMIVTACTCGQSRLLARVESGNPLIHLHLPPHINISMFPTMMMMKIIVINDVTLDHLHHDHHGLDCYRKAEAKIQFSCLQSKDFAKTALDILRL